MELLKLSKFKLQLQSLTTEVRYLREREHSATEQCNFLIQKQKQTEEEYGRKVQEMQSELASSNELQQKLERKVSYLQNDNVLLENKQKDLKETIQSLLQSRESFINAYEESICEMKRSIEERDKKINILSEKINSHLSLFNSIEKEAFSIKKVVDNVHCLVSEKEEVVERLRNKIDKASGFEKLFTEKIRDLQNELKSKEDELRRKDTIIVELEAKLEASKISDNHKNHIEELQRTLLAKDEVIQHLISQKEALHCQMVSLTTVIQKIKETVTEMNEEGKRTFSSIPVHQEDCNVVNKNEDSRKLIEDADQNCRMTASSMGTLPNQTSPTRHDFNSIGKPIQENYHLNSCVSELLCSPSRSPCSEHQSAANDPSTSANSAKVNSPVMDRLLDSECSATQVEISGDPGEPRAIGSGYTPIWRNHAD